MPTPISLPERHLPVAENQPQQSNANLRTASHLSAESLESPADAASTIGEIACQTAARLPERPTLRNRFFRSKVGRLAVTSLTALGLAGGALAVEASPAYAADPVYTAINPDNDGTFSIYDRNSPSWADSTRTSPDYSQYGDRLELICGTNGEAIGPYNNQRWHFAKNLSRPEAGTTWIPDRYLNTPNVANQPTPGEKECGTPEPAAASAIKACYLDLKAPSKDLTFSYEGDHRYLGNAWQAAKNWTDAGAGISIHHNNNNAYVRLKDIDTSDLWYAQTVIPSGILGKTKTTAPPQHPFEPSAITINVNRRHMDDLTDYYRTYVLSHEIGHALGLAHIDECGITDASIMKGGDGKLTQKIFNAPQQYDKVALQQLYGTP